MLLVPKIHETAYFPWKVQRNVTDWNFKKERRICQVVCPGHHLLWVKGHQKCPASKIEHRTYSVSQAFCLKLSNRLETHLAYCCVPLYFSIWYIQVQSRQYIVGRLFIWIHCLTADGWVCGLGGQISKLNSICKSFKKAENIWQF